MAYIQCFSYCCPGTSARIIYTTGKLHWYNIIMNISLNNYITHDNRMTENTNVQLSAALFQIIPRNIFFKYSSHGRLRVCTSPDILTPGNLNFLRMEKLSSVLFEFSLRQLFKRFVAWYVTSIYSKVMYLLRICFSSYASIRYNINIQ